jgi:hypothetical protein
MKKVGGVLVVVALLVGLLVLDASPAASAVNPVKHTVYCYDGEYHMTWKVREPFALFRDMRILHLSRPGDWYINYRRTRATMYEDAPGNTDATLVLRVTVKWTYILSDRVRRQTYTESIDLAGDCQPVGPSPSPSPSPSPNPLPLPSCDPAYPTVCIPPPPPDLNCDNVPYTDFAVLPPDPHGFDGDNDGIGCET